MLLVADANILFSFFNSKSKAREIILSGKVVLFSPKFLLKELAKHREEIKEKFGLDEKQFTLTLELIKALVEFKPLDEFKDLIALAKKHSPDEGDIQYLALAAKLALPLWSNDSKLKKQSMVKVISTKDLLNILRAQGL
jgi:predicted nucleic acid-binding protein